MLGAPVNPVLLQSETYAHKRASDSAISHPFSCIQGCLMTKPFIPTSTGTSRGGGECHLVG